MMGKRLLASIKRASVKLEFRNVFAHIVWLSEVTKWKDGNGSGFNYSECFKNVILHESMSRKLYKYDYIIKKILYSRLGLAKQKT